MVDNTQNTSNDSMLVYIIVGTIVTGILLIIVLCAALGLLTYKPILASYYYSQGVDYKAKGWIFKSKDYLKKAIELDPDGEYAKKARHFMKIRLPKSDNISPEAIQKNIIGYNFDQKGRFEEAISEFKEAIKISPEFEWPYNNLGRIYTKQKKYEEGITSFNKALELNPDYQNALINLGYLYWVSGYEFDQNQEYQSALEDYKKALDAYSKASELDPEDSRLLQDIRELKENIEYAEKHITLKSQ